MTARAGSAEIGYRGTGGEAYSTTYRWYVVLLLTFASTMYTADRVLLGVLIEPIKLEFGASDSQMGLVSLLSASAYAITIIPLGLLADRVNRKKLLTVILGGWSLMTVLSGYSRNLVHLAIAQMLVTGNEGGGAPTMTSLIADLFERSRRGLPTAIWYCGISLGGFVGFTIGGYLADIYGWRMTFIVLGFPGVIIALLVFLTVRETPRGMSDAVTRETARKPDFSGTFAFLKEQKALRHMLLGQMLSGLSFMGPISWMVSFLFRSHEASFAVAGSITGIVFLTTGVLSGPAGGFLMDRLGARDLRWAPWICCGMMVGGAIAFGAIYIMPTLVLAVIAIALWQFLTNAVSPITVATVSNLAPAQYRALSLSLGFLLFQLFGFGVGAQVIGLLSDWLANSWNMGSEDALRYACMSAVIFHFWGAFHYWLASRSAREGYERAAKLEAAA